MIVTYPAASGLSCDLVKWAVAVMHVFETHIHMITSPGLCLARETGAAYLMNAADEVAFGRVGSRTEMWWRRGKSMRMRVIATGWVP